jgi:hypothetical protein
VLSHLPPYSVAGAWEAAKGLTATLGDSSSEEDSEEETDHPVLFKSAPKWEAKEQVGTRVFKKLMKISTI